MKYLLPQPSARLQKIEDKLDMLLQLQAAHLQGYTVKVFEGDDKTSFEIIQPSKEA
jgi:hypothetical protein